MTLLLGPPGSGKTTLLKALSGKVDKGDLKARCVPRCRVVCTGEAIAALVFASLRHTRCFARPLRCGCMPHMQINGEITYNGHTLDEFVVQRTAAYIEQARILHALGPVS